MTETAHFGDRRPVEERQFDELIAELRGMIDDFDLGILDRSRPDGRRWSLTGRQLLSRARQRSRDKLPPPNKGGHSPLAWADPTGARAAADLDDTDEDLQHFRVFHLHLTTMRDAGARAIRELADATPAQQRPDRLEVGCRICSRPGHAEPVYRAERCEWCYRFWLRWRCDAPPGILKLRQAQKRITENRIRAELGELVER